jgi:hypothetical protein
MMHSVRRYGSVAAESRWRAVPRTERSEGRGVFALVVRYRVMLLFVYSRVGKNRDPPAGGSPRRCRGQPVYAGHFPVLFSHKILAVRSANDIYRPVRC